MPSRTTYQRLLGWHATTLRRLAITAVVGVVVAVTLSRVAWWLLAVLAGWNATAVVFLVTTWPIVIRADAVTTRMHARRDDPNRAIARALILAASGMSLVAVVFVLEGARHERGAEEIIMITIATVTVTMSWTVVNTLYMLRYADLHYRAPARGVDFAIPGGEVDYSDFAYLAFTIGMTYQVSDTTVRGSGIRRSVLAHSLISYVFGVAIVGSAVNIIAALAH